MAIIIQKFGGTSVASINRIKHVAGIIERTRTSGKDVVVVVSAMGDRTDELLAMARAIMPDPPRRELDMLLTTGERQTMSLLSMALLARGLDAVSFTGSQVGIITDDRHNDARIEEIRGDRLLAALRRHRIPIVAGFQGVSQQREITTLGRGGSDTTAVALAAHLGARFCEIYTDVNGIYAEDPGEFPGVAHLRQISYQEMLELASGGAQVLHPRACALAAKYRVPVRVLSSFEPGEGTLITEEETRDTKRALVHGSGRRVLKRRTSSRRRPAQRIEQALVRALTHSDQLSRLTLIGVPKVPKCLAQGVTELARARIPLVFFAHGVPTDDRFDLSYIVPASHSRPAEEVMHRVKRRVRARELRIQQNLSSVSVVGPGVGRDVEIVADVFATIARLGVHVDAFSTAETRITFFLHRVEVHKVISALLDHFKLRRSKTGDRV